MDQNGVHANKYDWYYLMNMLHSDYSNLWGEDVAQYVKFAKAYINDPDAGAGKVFICGERGNIIINYVKSGRSFGRTLVFFNAISRLLTALSRI